MLFELLPIRAADLPFMREMLYLSIFADPPLPRSILDEPDFRHYVEGWGRPHDAGFIAVNTAVNTENGEPLGAAWLCVLTHDDPGYGYVDNDTPEVCTLAVIPAARGCGIGGALMRALLNHADQHYAQVSLSCNPGNPAIRLYQRLGFVYHGISGTSHTILRRRPTHGR